MSEARLRAGAAAAALAVLSCTDTYLEDPRNQAEVPADRTVAIEGSFCTDSPAEVVRPIKILVMMDASQSMLTTDPNGVRAQALIDLMNFLPQDPEVEISVMVFAGSATSFLIADQNMMFPPAFHQLIGISQAERTNIQQRLLNFVAQPDPLNSPNRDATDFVKALADAYAMITRDIGLSRNMVAGNETRARYSIIFLSDGHPTNNQDDELLCGDAVVRIRQLKDLADDVQLNTVFVFNPTQPITSTVCNLDGGASLTTGQSVCRIPILPPGACPLLIVNQDAERLERMSQLGGGEFRDFRNNEPINFLNFRYGQVRHTFTVEQVVASNFSSPPGNDIRYADTDSDGLLDHLEAMEMTSPWDRDTDGDGFSDGVEVYFRGRGGMFTPNQMIQPDGGGLDFGCPDAIRATDTDCDGLLDCDEQLIGTNSLRVDSDDDGIPDMVEWQHKTSPSSRDLAQDPDNDQVVNGSELKLHTDPLVLDTGKLSNIGYRYKVERTGNVSDAGRQCYSLRIDNVSLANTLPDTRDAGNPDGGPDIFRRGAGYNDIYVSYASLPGDNPTGRTIVKHLRFKGARFPVGGIKSPPEGVIHVEPEDFVDRCGPPPMPTP